VSVPTKGFEGNKSSLLDLGISRCVGAFNQSSHATCGSQNCAKRGFVCVLRLQTKCAVRKIFCIGEAIQ